MLVSLSKFGDRLGISKEHTMDLTNTQTTIVIFGGSGDLTRRKLVPALYNNFKKDRLIGCNHIVGYARRTYDDSTFRDHLRQGVLEFSPESFDEATWQKFASLLTYYQGNLDQDSDFNRLSTYLQELEGTPANRLYYLAVAPEFYSIAVNGLGAWGMAEQGSAWRRIVVEKPFGRDLESAKDLTQTIHANFKESQVYRIDHYLGKETAQNILFLRFANTIFEPVWNRRYVDNIQITVAESVDVGHRAEYYDKAGVLRDMFQNHLLQLMVLVAMEAPASFNADAFRNESVKVVQSLRPISRKESVCAQYVGYRNLEGVAHESCTPTYAALTLYVDNWRWKGVPFYLRSGKALSRKTSEISVIFQQPPHLMFKLPDEFSFVPNILSMCIQPDEGIHLRFVAKQPDSDQAMRPVEMDFQYKDSFVDALPDAYERLILDVLEGDASLFSRNDGIEATWQLMDPFIKDWEQAGDSALATYNLGSRGPKEADELLQRDGRSWWLGCEEHE